MLKYKLYIYVLVLSRFINDDDDDAGATLQLTSDILEFLSLSYRVEKK